MLALALLLACPGPGDGGGGDSGGGDGGSGADGGTPFGADGEHRGPVEGEHCGEALAPAGDVDGDGAAELWVGCAGNAPDAESSPYVDAPARVRLLAGPATGTGGLDAPTAWLELPTPSLAMDAADIDGDAFPDLLAGSFVATTTELDSGVALLVLGPAVGGYDQDSAALRIEGDRRDEDLANALGIGIDLGGDGVAELLVAHRSAKDERVVAVVDGTARGVTTGDAWPQLRASPAAAAEGGLRLAGPARRADLDGDGLQDLLLRAAGGLFLVPGGTVVPGDADVDELGPVVRLPAPATPADAQVADLDGDGALDLVVSSVSAGDGPNLAGQAWGLAGPITGDREVEDAPLFHVQGDEEGGYLGLSIAAGDLDGDGQDDLVLGMPRGLFGGGEAGRVLRFAGPVAGSLGPTDAESAWTGPAGAGFGEAVLIQDQDGDGQPDLVVGGPHSDEGAWQGGAVFVRLSP